MERFDGGARCEETRAAANPPATNSAIFRPESALGESPSGR